MSEGVFSFVYESSQHGFGVRAFYFNALGEKVINLSEEVTDFKVTELGMFSNGTAEIKFIGADCKEYSATINMS